MTSERPEDRDETGRNVIPQSASQRVFISYSRQDAPLVTPVVGLLRATRDFVFLDADTIAPGRKWRAEIDSALRDASLVVVFWCRHSSESMEVQSEYRTAIAADKDVLPVLLDSTPVAGDLAEFQWIDFRELAGERHAGPASDDRVSRVPPAPAAWLSFRRWALPAAAAAAVLIAFLALRLSVPAFKPSPPIAETGRPSSAPTTAPSPPDHAPLPPPAPPVDVVLHSVGEAARGRHAIALVVLLTVVAGGILVVFRRRRGKPGGDHEAAAVQASRMSANLEEEIRRRLVAS